MMSRALMVLAVDGVLVDSADIRARCWSLTLAEQGFKLAPERCRRRLQGRSDRAFLSSVEAELGRPLPTALAAFEAHADTAYARELRPIHDVAATIRRLRRPACAVSGSSRRLARHALEIAGLWDLFAPNLFTTEMVDRDPPAADLYQFAAAEMGVPVGRCLVVEASANGIGGARAAGMPVYAFADPTHQDPVAHAKQLSAAGADMVLDRLRELAPLIGARAA